jgi:quercetin dioxygenase-like cupin family protein
MLLDKIDVIKSDERGVILDCGKSNFIFRKKGTISADHTHDEHEIFHLVKGEVEATVGEETQILKAPIKIDIPSNVYHKLIALSDFELVIDREGE